MMPEIPAAFTSDELDEIDLKFRKPWHTREMEWVWSKIPTLLIMAYRYLKDDQHIADLVRKAVQTEAILASVRADVERVEAKTIGLREALKFYADPINWDASACNGVASKAEYDAGHTARASLSASPVPADRSEQAADDRADTTVLNKILGSRTGCNPEGLATAFVNRLRSTIGGPEALADIAGRETDTQVFIRILKMAREQALEEAIQAVRETHGKIRLEDYMDNIAFAECMRSGCEKAINSIVSRKEIKD